MIFKREFDRYLVLKTKDIFSSVPEPLLTRLEDIIEELYNYLPDRNYVVVEDDWPEYEIVWKMIKDRCTND